MNRQQMLDELAKGTPPLEVAIMKWQDIADGVGEDGANCSLCYTYQRCDSYIVGLDDNCCEGFYDAYTFATTPEAKNSAALDMVAYLKSKRCPP
jgi:hypothetical protein